MPIHHSPIQKNIIKNSSGLFEIRVEVGSNVFRVFCFFDKGQMIILINGFQKITINSDKRIKGVSVDSSLKIFDDRKSVYVERSVNPIKINLQVDSTKKTILLKSHNSVAYRANIYFNYGIGMLVDKDNPKRYAYPKRIYLLSKNY